jgi:4-amino-4-deoxy-L-arabinose transferase-like glycosyltransferase
MVWDESRLGVSAVEMIQHNEPIVVTYGDQPDLWSVKPPFMIWLIALSFKLVGYTPLGLRLPSALFGLATIILVFLFCKKTLQNQVLGFFSAFILLTSWGFIDYHVTRTGDYDSMLIFWMTMSIFYFFKNHISESPIDKTRLLYKAAFFLSLAIFTKGIAALTFLPGILIFIISENQFKKYFSNYKTYFSILLAIIPILIYYFVREHQSSGYLKAVWEMEGPYRGINGDGDTGIIGFTVWDKLNYHIGKMFDLDFKPWFYLLPISVLTYLNTNNTNQGKAFKLFSISAFIFLMIVTFANTKKEWYEAPVYPILAIVIGFGIEKIYYESKKMLIKTPNKWIKYSLSLILACCFIFPFYKIISKYDFAADNLHEWKTREFSQLMFDSKKYLPFGVAVYDYNASLVLTHKILNIPNDKNMYEISIFDSTYFPKNLKIGDRIMFGETSSTDSINKYFEYKTLNSNRVCKLVEIEKLKR